jgi:hypothetical protein
MNSNNSSKTIPFIVIGVVLLSAIALIAQSVIPSKHPVQYVTPTVTPVETKEVVKPVISLPQANAHLVNPLVVTGTVPPGWMSEGVFPMKLLDAQRNIIAQGQGKEVTPGSWSSGKSIEFRGIVDFSTKEKSGFLVLEKDNPSGLPENAESFEIPVTF